MEERELKALQIAAKSKLTRRGKTWLVPSQSVRGAQYTVKLDPQELECSCPDFECRKQLNNSQLIKGRHMAESTASRTAHSGMVTGLFPDRDSAERAYGSLVERGYGQDDVNLIMSDETRKKHFAVDDRETDDPDR